MSSNIITVVDGNKLTAERKGYQLYGTYRLKDEFIKETVNKIHDDNSDQDFFSAIKICKKKRIGPARTEDNRLLFY